MASRLGWDIARVRRGTDAGDRRMALLHDLLDRIEADPDRTFFGMVMTQGWYQKALSWPSTVLSRPVHHPAPPMLFLSGMPRSGTTFANDLLASDDRLRVLSHADLDLDLKRVRRVSGWLLQNGLSDIEALHPLDAPPEDLQIMSQFVVADILGMYGAPYLRDMPEPRQKELFLEGYHFERQVYQRLPLRSDQRFVVKSPIIHMMFFEQFKRAFDPHYQMLILVRDMALSALSSCLLFEVGLKYLKHVDPKTIGPLVLYCMEGYVRGLEQLREEDLSKFLFIDFHRFVRDPMATVERIYPWLGLELTDAVRARYRERRDALERLHACQVPKPPPDRYHLDMDAVRALGQRYAAVYASRLV